MCGIIGWVDFDRDLERERVTIQAMTDSVAHRGPDGEGIWLARHAGLGHRRLAVIDVNGGAQPMVHRDCGRDTVTLVYGGEVYNYRDLRTELTGRGHRFDSASDTEVVLRGFLEWGEAIVDRLNGMYAFAIWDTRTEELLLVRDRLGVKPLYYYQLPTGILFGSEPKAILASGLVEPAVDAGGLCELFALVRTPGEAIFRGMREVPPGHLVRVRRSGLTLRQYWALAAYEHTDSLKTTIWTIRELLEHIVGRQIIADVPLCSLLSGGLDSSTVTALAQKVLREQGGERIRSYAVDFISPSGQFQPDTLRGTPDAPFVNEVVKCLATNHTNIALNVRELLSPQAWAATLRARDLPPLGDMDTSLYLACKAIREHATVALSGEAADEVFAGYQWFHDERAIAADNFPWLAMARRLGRQTIFEPRLARQLDVATYQADRYREALAQVPRLPGEEGLERRMREINYLHLTRFLPNPLDRMDRMSMAVGLEMRVPFCDHRLIEYVFNVPWTLKTFDGREKSLLRAAARDLLPQAVAMRTKSPFPTTQDPIYHRELRGAVSMLLVQGTAPVLPLLNRPTVRALVAMPTSGSQIVRLGLERILRLNEWLERYRVRIDV